MLNKLKRALKGKDAKLVLATGAIAGAVILAIFDDAYRFVKDAVDKVTDIAGKDGQ